MQPRSPSTSAGASATILIMAGHPTLGRLIAEGLIAAGYGAQPARDWQHAQRLLSREHLDLAIVNVLARHLDVPLLRTSLGRIPVIEIAVCAAGHRPHGAILGPQPGDAERFDLRALRARVDAQQSGPSTAARANGSDPLRVGDLIVERSRERATLAGADLPLTPTEYWLLRVLAERSDEVVARAELAGCARGRAATGGGHALTAHLARLRAKLLAAAASGPRLVPVRGAGYRLVQPVVARALTSANSTL
jgi:DNA-binding response OmpR family regulator